MSDGRQVEQVLARYVRAADRRSSVDVAALFAADAEVEILLNQDGISHPIGALVGADTIGHAVAGLMRPHPERGWSPHMTSNAIVEVRGDSATLEAQFVVFNTVGSPRPAGDWPDGAAGAQGVVQPIEAGYYASALQRVDGVWKITRHRITHDLPYAFPGA
ncbi:nuclear transport factor 2 family protein [Pelomonas cellulosilytica]|uniref:Nuclear transport factor 2 family protein n=1 Tax=Pelomonas cellulosilytica TaxID=2906762 RepID=A0ABS8XUJ4_9BURK|nr:nuclear transport factor 2 family protein [Pelomonas sp. P8]MCE4554398.1 nuclear transport factor 2 family protein [Pelomonas sp. P8]